jgi:regulatory protein
MSSRPAPGAHPDDAVAAAVRFVVRSTRTHPQTEAEVAAKLRRGGHDETVIDRALAEARRQGLVDDAAFAAAWVEDRGRNRGFGTARLRDELDRRGVCEADIDAALHRLADRDDHTAAVELARRRAAQLPGTLSVDAKLRRLGGYLVRRGHAPGLAERAAREVLDLPDPVGEADPAAGADPADAADLVE